MGDLLHHGRWQSAEDVAVEVHDGRLLEKLGNILGQNLDQTEIGIGSSELGTVGVGLLEVFEVVRLADFVFHGAVDDTWFPMPSYGFFRKPSWSTVVEKQERKVPDEARPTPLEHNAVKIQVGGRPAHRPLSINLDRVIDLLVQVRDDVRQTRVSCTETPARYIPSSTYSTKISRRG